MRVLVTGASGFAGRHLSERLVSKRANVYGLAHSKRPLARGVKAVRADLSSVPSLVSMLKKVRPARIYHLAAQASVAVSWKKPGLTFGVNVRGTRSLLEAARRACPRARVLVACSADEYGKGRARQKLNENAPLRPINPYGVSKLLQDLLARRYFLNHGLHVVRTRAFNHIGPGQSDTFAISSFAKQVARIEAGRQKPEIKVGNLAAVRDFTDVRDVARAYWLALERGKPGEVYNVASGRGRRVEELLKYYLRRSSVRIKVSRDRSRMRASDAPYLVGDARKLRRATGWKPAIALERTLDDALKDWKGRLRAES